MFQLDNNPKHTSHVAKDYFKDKRISDLNRPAQSPELNPIEHLGGILDEKLPRSGLSNRLQ